MPRSILFPYRKLEKKVDAYWSENRAYKQARGGWQMFKGMIVVNSVVHYGVKPTSTEYMRRKGLHLSWEDACVALRGGGDDAMSGPLITMWGNMFNDDERVKLGQIMNSALVKVYNKADKIGYKHRYEAEYRVGPVVIDADRFDLPIQVPTSGGRLYNHAADEGIDLELARELLMNAVKASEVRTAQNQKRLMKELERIDPTPHGLRLVKGGKT